MARERTGTIYPGPKGELHVKFTIDILDADGKKVGTKRDAHNLHTFDGRVAQLKKLDLLRRLQANGALPKAEAKEVIKASPTFQEAAEAVLEGVRIKTVGSQKQRLAAWAYPTIGHLRVNQIKSSRVFVMCLEKCRDEGKSLQTGIHLKSALAKVWELLKDDGMVPEELAHLALKAKMPQGFKLDGRERAVLTDEELQTYLQFRHHNAKLDVHVLERQTKCVLARLFGGARTSEVHRLKWTDFTIEDGEFIQGRLRRSKVKGPPQTLEVPSQLRPIIHMWWAKAGKPETGFLFGKVKGEIGEQRCKTSIAEALRRDLARAFGLEKWDEEAGAYKPDPMAKPTRRQTILLQGDEEEFLPVDFHSWRRRFCQSVDTSGLTGSAARNLSGHKTESSHSRYLRDGSKVLALPEGAMPRSPLLLHDPALTAVGETVVTEIVEAEAIESVMGVNDSIQIEHLSGHKRRMGRQFLPAESSENAGISEVKEPRNVQVSDGTVSKPTDFRTTENERLPSEAPPENCGNWGGSKIPDDTVLNDWKPRVLPGGADAMQAGVLVLTRLMTEALEASDWVVAEQFSAQLQRVIQVRTNAKKEQSR